MKVEDACQLEYDKNMTKKLTIGSRDACAPNLTGTSEWQNLAELAKTSPAGIQ